jgi:hypothetical protein
MARRRKSRIPDRPRPADLEHAPETDAVRLPAAEEPHRGERPEHAPGAGRKPSADAFGEGNVTELAQDLDEESIRTLEKNSRNTQPRAVPSSRRRPR